MGPSPPGPAQPTWAIPRAHSEPVFSISLPQECKNPLAPDRLLCHSPAFPFESNVDVVLGNLSVLLDGADGRWLFRLRYYSRPKVYPLEQEGRRLHLKPGEDEIEVHVRVAAG